MVASLDAVALGSNFGHAHMILTKRARNFTPDVSP